MEDYILEDESNTELDTDALIAEAYEKNDYEDEKSRKRSIREKRLRYDPYDKEEKDPLADL